MKLAIVGSRGIHVDISTHIPPGVTHVVSGGATGVDACAEQWAQAHGIPTTILLPDYARWGKTAPLMRNRQIVDAADRVMAIWDGVSKGTKFTIDYARRLGKPVHVVIQGCEQGNLFDD